MWFPHFQQRMSEMKGVISQASDGLQNIVPLLMKAYVMCSTGTPHFIINIIVHQIRVAFGMKKRAGWILVDGVDRLYCSCKLKLWITILV